MKSTILFALLLVFAIPSHLIACEGSLSQLKIDLTKDSSIHEEIDNYLKELSRTVKEGDFEGYGALYDEDAVVVFATGSQHLSMPISKALSGWKKGFEDTKAGKASGNVAFRFSQRISDASTAHLSGIFHYAAGDSHENTTAYSFVHFEMLMIKKNNKWLCLMEYQKSTASEKEWDALK